jgi:His Kinase A (phospho-acceptor) domain
VEAENKMAPGGEPDQRWAARPAVRREASHGSAGAARCSAAGPQDRPGQPIRDLITGNPASLRQFSHELRTPLNVILGNVELLLDGSAGPLTAQARTSLGEVQSACLRLSRQVQLLLLWLAVRGGGVKRGDSTLDLIALVQDVRAIRHGDPLPVEPLDARLKVRGDRSWLQTLVAEVLELAGARRGPLVPAVRLDHGTDGASLVFVWTDFCPAEVEPLQVALIESIAEVHGAGAALVSDGIRLYWPAAQLAAAVATTGAPILATGAGCANPDDGDQSRGRG